MPPTSGSPGFPMNPMNMAPQHQAQRMQPPPPSSTPTQPGPRASSFPGPQHNTPPNGGPQSQFSTPQPAAQARSQTPNNNQQGQAGTILTPQTPNFPPGSQVASAGGPVATPLSPGSESREKERVTLLLDINRELLLAVVQIQAAQAEAKKEDTATATSPKGADKEKTEQEKAEKEKADKEKAEKAKPASREYFEYVPTCSIVVIFANNGQMYAPTSVKLGISCSYCRSIPQTFLTDSTPSCDYECSAHCTKVCGCK